MNCDMCKEEITSLWYVDGKTVEGPWAFMCPKCFRKYGIGLGTGRGQAFFTKTGNKINFNNFKGGEFDD